jgi:hypothetical protein
MKLYKVEYLAYEQGVNPQFSLLTALTGQPLPSLKVHVIWVLAENTDSVRDKLLLHLSDKDPQKRNMNIDILCAHLMGDGGPACFDDLAVYVKSRAEAKEDG